MRKLVGALLVLALATALLSGGRERIGHLLLSGGMPSAAAALLQDPTWRGVALYSARRWREAADAFRTSGAPESAYNLGNALAQAHLYADALAAYDDALRENPDDDDARSNRALVAALLKAEGVDASRRARGSAGSIATKEREGHGSAAPDENARSTGPEGMAGRHESSLNSGWGGSALDRANTVPVHSFGAVHGQSGGSGTNYAGIGQSGGLRRTLLEDSVRMGKPANAQSVQADTQWLKALPDDPGSFLKLRLAAEHNRRVDTGTAPPITGDPW